MYPFPVDCHVAESKEIPVGNDITLRKYIWYDNLNPGKVSQAIFSYPGIYLIRAELKGGSKTRVQSNILMVNIDQPQGVNLAAWNNISSTSDSNKQFFFELPYPKDKRFLGKASALKDFANQNGYSLYSTYAWYALGTRYNSIKDYDNAGYAYRKVLERANFINRDEVLGNLATISAKQGNLIEAHKYLDSLKKDYPDSKYTNYVSKEIQKAEQKQEHESN